MNLDDMFSTRETLKILAASYALGLVFAGSGRLAGGDLAFVIPGVPLTVGMITGPNSLLEFTGYLAYGVGVATVYVDKLTPFFMNYFD